jgi:hypothetical protein
VAEGPTYYAIVRDHESAASPSGLARRTFTPEGRLDETLRHDFTWQRDSAIYEWERGEEMGAELIEISEDEAQALIERFREKWAQRES